MSIASVGGSTSTTSRWADATVFEAFLQSLGEPAWLREQRRAAWDLFQEKAWPQRSDEEWIRTDIRLFRLDSFAPPTVEAAPVPFPVTVPAPLLTAGVDLAGQSTSWNSQPISSVLRDEFVKKGVLFGPLETLLAEHHERLRPYLAEPTIAPGYDKFSALAAAYWRGGQVLFVPRGVSIPLPLHVHSVLGPDGVDLQRLVVILEDGAEATVLCENSSVESAAGAIGAESTKADAGLHCGSTELRLGAGANLRFVNFQNWGHGVWHFAHQRAEVGRDSGLQWTIAALGSRLAKVNQQVALTGPGAHCQVNGVLFTQEKQHLSYHTLQHHRAPSCRSDFLYKAALQDRSRTVWRGMIKVDPNAQKTDGYQRNDNLLLSTASRADSIPGLEIEADDVRCTHGSTSGKVEEELIFYAQSRGLTRKEAVRLIVTGFFQQVFDRITIDSVREALGGAIALRVREYA